MNHLKRAISILISVAFLFSGISVFSAKNADILPSHIIINQVYGGGDRDDIETPVSNSFIELYNPEDADVNIDGWSVQYSAGGTDWDVFALNGVIRSHNSYLIKCCAHNADARFKISEYDASWDIAINNKGMKVLLKSDAERCTVKNPYAANIKNYVDMACVAGNERNLFIDGCETDYAQIQSKQKSIRRSKFRDTDNNAADFSAIDYRTADLTEIRPRSSADGSWTYTDFIRTKEIEKKQLGSSEADAFTFLNVSDTQASTNGQFKKWGELTEALKNENYDFTVHTGDITDNANNETEMDMFYENSGNVMDKPFIPVVGNHDQKINTSPYLYEKYFGTMPGEQAPFPVTENTTASFDHGNAHFIILNTESDLQTQASWLDSELAKTNKKWKIVALHRSPYGAQGINDTDIFVPIFDKYHVDLVLQGHDHLYLRTYPLINGKRSDGGTVYLESGSSGVKQEKPLVKQEYQEVSISPQTPCCSLISVNDDEISVNAEKLSGGRLTQLDTFSIKKYSGQYDEQTYSGSQRAAEYFSDIRRDKPEYAACCLLASLGIIDNVSAFMPNDKVSEADFLGWLKNASGAEASSNENAGITTQSALEKILAALGYDKYIKSTNADEEGIIADLALMKNISAARNEEMTRGTAVLLIKNALETYTVEPYRTSGNTIDYGQSYTRWLDKNFHVYKIKGIITDRPYYTENSANDQVTFVTEYGEKINCGCSENVYSLLGYEVEAYIKDPYDGGKMLFASKTEKNNTLVVKKKQFGTITDTNNNIIFAYTDKEGKGNTLKIDRNAAFIYNEALNEKIRNKVLLKDEKAMKPTHNGQVTLVDCNDDNIYDFVFIDDYKDIVVSGIDEDTKTITNKLVYDENTSDSKTNYTELPSVCLDEKSGDRITFMSPEGDPLSFSSITKDSVISVALNTPDTEDPTKARIKRVYISNLSASGKISSIYTDDGDDYFVINGAAYKMSKSYYSTYNKGSSVNFPDLHAGDYVSFYLDYDEKAAYVTGGRLGTEQYGIVIDYGYLSADPNNDAFVKIFSSDGKCSMYRITEKRYKKLSISSMSVPSLVKFINTDDELTYISKEAEIFSQGDAKCITATKRLGNYFYDSGTCIFAYNGAKNDANVRDAAKYSVSDASFLRNKHTYNADISDVSDNMIIGASVIYFDASAPVSDDDPVMIVSEVKEKINEESEKAYIADGYGENGKESIEITATATAPTAGDIIQYRLMADGTVDKWRLLANSTTQDLEINSMCDDFFFAEYNSPKRVYGNILTVTYGSGTRNLYVNNDAVVYNIYTDKRLAVEAGKAEGITSRDKIFVISEEGKVNEIFVRKED